MSQNLYDGTNTTGAKSSAHSNVIRQSDTKKPISHDSLTEQQGDNHPHHHEPSGGALTRFSVAMPEELLMRFDALVARRGIAKNRSEMVRDLVRDALIREEADIPGVEVMGTLTIVFNHHESDVQETLHQIQHAHYEMIVSTTHVHLDEHNCLEVIILRGETTEVRLISDQILGAKGVKNGGLVVTTVGQMI